MKKNVIICSSHLYVPTALTYILSHKKEIHYIYTDNHSIKQLFDNSSLGINVIDEPKLQCRLRILKIIKLKKWIKRQFDIIQPDSFLFFHDGFGMPINWFLLKQKDKYQVNYCPVYTDDISQVRIRSISQLRALFSNKLFWGIWVIPIKGLNGSITPYLSPSFFSHILPKIVDVPIDKQLINKNIDKICPSIVNSNDKVIIFLQCEIVGYSINEDNYVSAINKIIEKLEISQCRFKGKPGREKCYGKEKELKKIPDYISAPLILSTFKVVIGTTSTVLAQSANEGILSLSLIELIPTQDEQQKKLVIDYLTDLSPNIKYPKSYDELFDLIYNA